MCLYIFYCSTCDWPLSCASKCQLRNLYSIWHSQNCDNFCTHLINKYNYTGIMLLFIISWIKMFLRIGCDRKILKYNFYIMDFFLNENVARWCGQGHRHSTKHNENHNLTIDGLKKPEYTVVWNMNFTLLRKHWVKFLKIKLEIVI